MTSKEVVKKLLKALDAKVDSTTKPDEVTVAHDENSAELTWILKDGEGESLGELVMELLPSENSVRVTLWPPDDAHGDGVEPIELSITTKK